MIIFSGLSYEDNRPAVGGIYLHGTLELLNGFDLVAINEDELPRVDGIFDCAVLMNECEYNAKLFFWQGQLSKRGLIVSVDDDESLEYAKARFDERAEIL